MVAIVAGATPAWLDRFDQRHVRFGLSESPKLMRPRPPPETIAFILRTARAVLSQWRHLDHWRGDPRQSRGYHAAA
jgi:hypothetical protein